MKKTSNELERGILGRIILDNSNNDEIKSLISDSSFYFKGNKAIFEVIYKLWNQNTLPELSLIISELEKAHKLDLVGGKDNIKSIIDDAILPRNIVKACMELSRLSQLRNVESIIDGLKTDINKSDISVLDFLNDAEEKLLSSTRIKSPTFFRDSKEIINEAVKDIEDRAANKNIDGLMTDFDELDRITGGLQKGDLIIIAGRPSMGKTAFALNIAANISENKLVGVFSLEMPSRQLFKRILSSKSLVGLSKLRDGLHITKDEWNKIYIAKNNIEKMQLYVDESANLTLAELMWKAKKLHEAKGLDLIIIDYMQLITHSVDSGNRQLEVSAISSALKKLARELDIPVIALSQLSRKVELRENKKPIMSDLRESGAIEQDADLIMFLYREGYYNKDKSDIQSTDLIISKHRNGSTGSIQLHFTLQYGLFSDFLKDDN